MTTTTSSIDLRVADEVWIVLALLHREHPGQPDFAIEEIMARAREERVLETLRPGFYIHVNQHCVANRPPNPARYRMLLETANGRRRLFREGDNYHPEREGAKVTPRAENMPAKYRTLLAWYRDWAGSQPPSSETDPILALRGIGRKIWADEHADDYVRRLREGWQ